ncbi:MAG: hypothetical protein Q4G49_15960 [Paracoccus sp. (in: a-proteobacteria)]|nr:hypothetical protein [Paracoccus sp. (in: a-proteobacteria)]
MRQILIWTMMLCLTACAGAPVKQTAICDGTRASRTALAAALVDDGGPASRRAGMALIDQIDAGCSYGLR